MERAIDTLEKVRSSGYAIRLHLCGQIPYDRYGRSIRRLCKKNADWIIPEGQVSGTRKALILTRARFGIQTTSGESFGIAVAEMVKAGAIVFAPSNGGAAETLQHSGLLFTDSEEAVEKIRFVLQTPALQSALQVHLREQAHVFSANAFIRAANARVQEALCRNMTGNIVTPSEDLCTKSHSL